MNSIDRAVALATVLEKDEFCERLAKAVCRELRPGRDFEDTRLSEVTRALVWALDSPSSIHTAVTTGCTFIHPS